MKTSHVLFQSLVIAGTILLCSQANAAKVCYLPFHYETSVPVTPSSIMQEKCRKMKDSDSIFKQLLNYVSEKPKTWSGKPDFNFLLVRLEISRENQPPIFVDQQGVVLVSNERYLLDTSILDKIENLLNKEFGHPPQNKE